MAKLDLDTFDFSLKLYKALELNENSVVSPFSLVSALSMTLYGSRKNTGKELSKVLFGKVFPLQYYKSMVFTIKTMIDSSIKSNSNVLSTANFMYINNNFHILTDFQQTLESYFYAKALELDLVGHQSKAIEIINNDISVATKGKIPKIIETIDPLTRLILVNAVYFKGLWKYPFSITRPEQFISSRGENVEVNMMLQTTIFPFGKSDELKCKAIELPYIESNIVMVLLLPDQQSSLNELESNLNIEPLNILLNKLIPVRVALSLPRFKVQSSHYLGPVLSKMGVRDIFSANDANFSGITNDPLGLFVGDVIQNALIVVNEVGTEAAAATASRIRGRSAPKDLPEEFKANRPFLFVLVSKYEPNKRIILFMGAVHNPKQ